MLTATCLFPFPSAGAADPMPVPINLQVEIIKRMFGYDKAVANEAKPVIFVVHQEVGPVKPDEVVKAFEVVGLVSIPVRLDALASQIQTPSAVYVVPGVDPSAVKQYCAEKRALSISGIPELAENGSVAVSIGEEDNRPQIIVHRKRLQDEGHSFSAQLLRLARVIQ
jgi:hypothetical protein